MSDAQRYAVLTQRGAPPWTCRARSAAHAFERWLADHPKRKRNLRFGPRKTVYSERLVHYVWTEHIQSDTSHTIVVRGRALVCHTDHVTPSDLSGDKDTAPA